MNEIAFRVDPQSYGREAGHDHVIAGKSLAGFNPVDHLIECLGVETLTRDLIGVDAGSTWGRTWARFGQQWVQAYRSAFLDGCSAALADIHEAEEVGNTTGWH